MDQVWKVHQQRILQQKKENALKKDTSIKDNLSKDTDEDDVDMLL